jgi:hypothetical protein
MPVKKVRNAVGHDASCYASLYISWHNVNIPLQVLTVVVAHDSNINICLTTSQGLDGLTPSFQGFVNNFHEHSLLGINSVRFNPLNAKKSSIEEAMVFIEEV